MNSNHDDSLRNLSEEEQIRANIIILTAKINGLEKYVIKYLSHAQRHDKPTDKKAAEEIAEIQQAELKKMFEEASAAQSKLKESTNGSSSSTKDKRETD